MLSKIAGVIGKLFLVAGVLVALLAFHLLHRFDLETGKVQQQVREELQQAWPVLTSVPAPASESTEPAVEGSWMSGSAVVVISALKVGFSDLVVFEGVSQEVLCGGPGHYPNTALSGQVGNSSYAAHRDGHGAPFNNIDRPQTHDDITIETRDATYRYKVSPVDGMAGVGESFDCVPTRTNVPEIPGQYIVTPGRADVLNPVGDATLLTLTTCHPQWDNIHRFTIHTVLVDVETKEVNQTYAAYWRSLPGPQWVRAIITIAIVVIVFLLSMNHIFPWAVELIPSNDVSLQLCWQA